MLETEALVIKYGPFLALDGVDICVDDGEIVGVIGANGAGKSSLVRAIAGLVRPASGRVAVRGQGARRRAAASAHPHRHRARARRPRPVRAHVGRREFDDGRLSAADAPSHGRQHASAASICFRCCASGGISSPVRCRADSNRCWRSCMGLMSEPKLLILDEPSLGLRPDRHRRDRRTRSSDSSRSA